MFKVIIAGPLTFDDYELLKRKMDRFLKDKNPHSVAVLLGVEKGSGTLWERYAAEHGFPVEYHPPNPKSSDPLTSRNKWMLRQASACVCFWDRRCFDTRELFRFAREYDVPLRVVEYKAKENP